MPNTTNADLMREIKRGQEADENLLAMFKDHESRIRPLENFVIAYDAALKAVQNINPPRTGSLNKDFVNVVLKFIALLTIMVGLIYLIVSKLVPN